MTLDSIKVNYVLKPVRPPDQSVVGQQVVGAPGAVVIQAQTNKNIDKIIGKITDTCTSQTENNNNNKKEEDSDDDKGQIEDDNNNKKEEYKDDDKGQIEDNNDIRISATDLTIPTGTVGITGFTDLRILGILRTPTDFILRQSLQYILLGAYVLSVKSKVSSNLINSMLGTLQITSITQLFQHKQYPLLTSPDPPPQSQANTHLYLDGQSIHAPHLLHRASQSFHPDPRTPRPSL